MMGRLTAIGKCHHCDAGRLIDESQSRALVRGNISLFAPGRKGDGTNPDPGEAEAGLPSFVVARAGAVAPTTTSTRGAGRCSCAATYAGAMSACTWPTSATPTIGRKRLAA